MRGNVKEFDLISLGEVLIDFIPTGGQMNLLLILEEHQQMSLLQ